MTTAAIHRSVLDAAWRAAGEPIPTSGGLVWRDLGTACARCQRPGQTAAASKVLSEKATIWDSLATAVDPRFCPACAWAYRNPGLRNSSYKITNTPEMSVLSRADLEEIAARPIPESEAIVVPLTYNRRHVITDALWGRLTTDGIALIWDQTESDRFAAFRWLRHHGFTSTAIQRPAPDFAQMITLPADLWDTVQTRWDQLTPWRDGQQVWMTVASKMINSKDQS